MTTYYVTTGTSLSEHSRCWVNDAPTEFYTESWWNVFSKKTLREGWEKNKQHRDSVLDAVNQQPDGDAKSQSAKEMVRESFSYECWKEPNYYRALPAEVATIAKMCDEKTIFANGDVIRILWGNDQNTSSAPGNEADARLIHAILKHVRDTQETALTGVDIQIETNGLDWAPTHLATFRCAMDYLWKENICKILNKDGANFILTGGYKAVVLDMAIRIGRQLVDGASTTFYYTHEHDEQLVTININMPNKTQNEHPYYDKGR